MSWWSYQPYVSAARKRANAATAIAKLQRNGRKLSPVTIDGQKIARTFWGKAWCDNLESYSDYDNRLPRGRSYVRNGSVIDLQVAPGRVTALVQGSSLYKVRVDVQAVAAECWAGIKRDCAGQVGSLIELLQGKLSGGVMGVITRADGGLFPKPAEIKKSCSCPDWADMCKHVAAVLYAVGARLDHEPEVLFHLRQVDHLDLIAQAGDVGVVTNASTGLKTVGDDDLADVFGIELEPRDKPHGSPATSTGKPHSPEAPRRKTRGASSTGNGGCGAGSDSASKSGRRRAGTKRQGRAAHVPPRKARRNGPSARATRAAAG